MKREIWYKGSSTVQWDKKNGAAQTFPFGIGVVSQVSIRCTRIQLIRSFRL